MYAIIGAAGNVGYSTSKALRDAGAPVRALVRDAAKGARLREIGCETIVADIQDPAALSDAIAVQVILPFSPGRADPIDDMCRSGESLIQALSQACTARVLAISDYGAHEVDDIGMPSIFRDFEAGLRKLSAQVLILRSAEHMHNWGRVVPSAIGSGVLPSFQDPVDMEQPTIAAQDLGAISADFLLQPHWERGLMVVHAEGPRRYSAADVAEALSQLAGKPIRAQAVPRSEWASLFAQTAPNSLADILIRTNDAKNKGNPVDVEPGGDVRHGTTALVDAIRPLLLPC